MNTEPNYAEQVATILNRVSAGTLSIEDAINGGQSTSITNTGVAGALALPTVWNAIQRIAGHIGSLPVEVRRPTDSESNSSSKIDGHPACRVFNEGNVRQTGQILRETIQANALLQGNGKAYIVRNTLGQPIELVLIPPAYNYTMMWNGAKWHIISLPRHYLGDRMETWSPVAGQGGPPNGWYRVPDEDIFHLYGISYDGLWGIDVLHNSRRTFQLDDDGQDAAAFSFRNNGRPGLILEAPRNAFPDEKSAAEFMANFNAHHAGLQNQGKTGLLRNGMTAHVLPTSASDAQHLESRRFSREDIALLFGVESVMGEGSAVYKDRQDRMLAYLQNCLGRWFAKWNTEAQRKLFSARDRAAGSFLQFDVRPLIMADPNTTADYTGKLAAQKITSVNELREFHRLTPVPNGDEVITEEPAEESAGDEGQEELVSGTGGNDEREDPENFERLKLVARIGVERSFEELIRTEAREYRRASKDETDRDGRFSEVAENSEKRFRKACLSYSIPEELAKSHCDKSFKLVSEAESPEAVAEVCKNWKTRAGEFANAI